MDAALSNFIVFDREIIKQTRNQGAGEGSISENSLRLNWIFTRDDK